MTQEAPTSLPHSALNTHLGADANLGLLLLCNNMDYFNFEGLIDAYLSLDIYGDPIINVLHTGKIQEALAEEAISNKIVSASGIYETSFTTNPDFRQHFIELIEDRPDCILPSLVDRGAQLIEKMKSKTPRSVAAEQKKMAEGFQADYEANLKAETIINPNKLIPISGERKGTDHIKGELTETIEEQMRDHLREELGSSIVDARGNKMR